jgi:hypothetical protein
MMMTNKPAENPKTLTEAIERIRILEASLQTARADTVREVVSILQIESSDFYYNEPNDYGSITTRIYTGEGNPWELFRGDEIQAKFNNGVRGTGYYQLNDEVIPIIMERLDQAKQTKLNTK